MNISGKLMEAVGISLAEGFCKAAHFGQKRKFTGEDYCNHPIRVANVLSAHGYKSVAVQIAALLHDVIEDTPITKQYIATYFGQEVADIVEWLTKRDWKRSDGTPLKRWERKELEADRLKTAPVVVKTIKLADRLDNLPSVIEHDPKFAPVIVAETRYLLDHALKEGDTVLWAKLDAIVREYQQQHA